MSVTLGEYKGKELSGEPFYNTNLPNALRKAQEYSKDGLVAPMYLLMKGFPHKDWFSANSEDHSGKGEFQGKNGFYVITIHGGKDGGGILTPEVIEEAYKQRVTPVYAADLTKLFPKKYVIRDLLHGGLPDGTTIPVFSYEQLVAGESPTDLSRFAIVRTLEQAKKTNSSYQEIDGNLLDADGNPVDSQVIAYAAGISPAKDFLKKARAKTDSLGVWHPFNLDSFDPEQPQGRVLFLGNYDFNGLGGSRLLGSLARFVGVLKVAEGDAQKIPSLEQVLSLSEDFCSKHSTKRI